VYAELEAIALRVESMMPPDAGHATTVAIVEDDAAIRAAWKAIINRMPGYRCVAEFGTAEEALAKLPKAAPEIVLMDINLPGKSGIECTRELKGLAPKTEVVMLTMFGDRDNLFEALQAGACGYLLKRTTPDALREALDQARSGGAPMSPQIARQVVEFFQRQTPLAASASSAEVESLSPREAEVLRLLAEGQPYKNIAAELELTMDTIRTYIRRIYQKLHVNSRTEAVVKFLQSEGRGEG
jgi:DNA-binding NarL/FixJ family response regulator